ncbi:MAG: hypothetical protein Q9208_003371 [Pyrenodesmia sp. 3 TL-2023]
MRRSGRIRKPRVLESTARSTRFPRALASSSSSSNPFPFFSLPAEIRNMVYGHFVHFPRGVVKAKTMNSRLRPFLVNRQLFTEASALFYACNVFNFYSAYVSGGEDPFGFDLTRIRKCFLHLTGTHPGAYDFLTWYLKEFADALVKRHSLECLLLRVSPRQLHQIETLAALRGIEFVQVNVIESREWLSGWLGPHLQSLPVRHHPSMMGPTQLRLCQLLERLMMSDGSAAAENDIRKRALKAEERKEKYVANPALSVQLRGEAAQLAKRHGGWADPYALYRYLDINPWIQLRRWR